MMSHGCSGQNSPRLVLFNASINERIIDLSSSCSFIFLLNWDCSLNSMNNSNNYNNGILSVKAVLNKTQTLLLYKSATSKYIITSPFSFNVFQLNGLKYVCWKILSYIHVYSKRWNILLMHVSFILKRFEDGENNEI